MRDIKVSLDLTCFKSKPDAYKTSLIADRIAINIKTFNRDSIYSFAELVGIEGYTFCPATFKQSKDGSTYSRKSKENFEQIQLLALDFDNETKNEMSFEEVKTRADHYDLPILFAYETFTSKNHDKFRVVFLNENPILDIRVGETMLKALTTIFPEADKQSKSVVQMYYGSNKGLLYFDKTIPMVNIESLIRNTTNYLEDRYGTNHYKRKVAEFSRDTGIALNNKQLLDVSVVNEFAEVAAESPDGNFLPKSIIYIPFGRKLPNRYFGINYGERGTNYLGGHKKPNYHRPYRANDFGSISSYCQLFKEFESGERRLHHLELFGIATNIIQVQTGEDRFRKVLQKHSYYGDQSQRYQKWNQDLRRIKESKYKPYSCNGFCPYYDTCSHGTNILSTAIPRYHQMERLDNYVEHYVTTDEAEKDLRRKLTNAVESNRKGWHVIKAQTALGKTQAYLELLKDTSLRVLIAVPTVTLKREIYEERAAKMGIKLTESPSLRDPEYGLPNDVLDEIESFYRSGKFIVPYLKEAIA